MTMSMTRRLLAMSTASLAVLGLSACSANATNSTQLNTPSQQVSTPAPASPTPEPEPITYGTELIEVVDGNTVRVRVNREHRRNGVTDVMKDVDYEMLVTDPRFDVPEDGACGAEESAAALAEILGLGSPELTLKNDTVRLMLEDPSYVYGDEGGFNPSEVNEAGEHLLEFVSLAPAASHMLRDGFATYGKLLPTPEQAIEGERQQMKDLMGAQTRAQEASKGLWGTCGSI